MKFADLWGSSRWMRTPTLEECDRCGQELPLLRVRRSGSVEPDPAIQLTGRQFLCPRCATDLHPDSKSIAP